MSIRYKKFFLDQIYNDLFNVWNKAQSLSGATLYIFVIIDAFSFLSMKSTQNENTKHDFIEWVNKYLKTDSSEAYKYSGKDFYGARCGKLHAFSAESAFAKKNGCKLFGYHGGINHLYNPAINEELVLISVPLLIKDLSSAINHFIQDILDDPDLKNRVDSRIDKLYEQFDRTATNE